MVAAPSYGSLGLSEHELRKALEEELERAVGVERDLSTHAIAHSVARILQLDHQRIAEQLDEAGIQLGKTAQTPPNDAKP